MNILSVSGSTFTNIDFYYIQDKKKMFVLLIMYICHMSYVVIVNFTNANMSFS